MKRSECKFRQDLGYDYSCGAYESCCNHPKSKNFYCIHEGHKHRCPLKIDNEYSEYCEKKEVK